MRTRIRVTLAALGATAALALPAAPAFAQTDLDCADFPSQAAAQAELRRNPSDPNRLDEDDDFIACENFRDYPAGSARDETPAAPAAETRTAQTSTVRVPTRVDTGAGGTAPTAALPLGLACAAVAAAATATLTRRRPSARR